MGNVLNSSILPGLLLECREAAQAGQCLGVMMLLSPDLSPQFQPWGPPDCQRLCLSLLSHLTGMKTAPKRILSLSKGFCAVFPLPQRAQPFSTRGWSSCADGRHLPEKCIIFHHLAPLLPAQSRCFVTQQFLIREGTRLRRAEATPKMLP